jgi:MFS family permease
MINQNWQHLHFLVIGKNSKQKFLLVFFFKGSYIGTLITMMFGGLIAAYWSWEWIFYLSGKILFN